MPDAGRTRNLVPIKNRYKSKKSQAGIVIKDSNEMI